MAKITKEEITNPLDKLDGKLNGKLDSIDSKKQLKVIKCDYDLAKKYRISYSELLTEINEYAVELPREMDALTANFSDINIRYHEAQGYATRISSIEIQAVANLNAWSKVKYMLDQYIMDRESVELLKDEVTSLSNARLQNAAVRNNLSKVYAFANKIKISESDAKAFLNMVKIKRKDLQDTIQNLNRQIKVLSLDKHISH